MSAPLTEELEKRTAEHGADTPLASGPGEAATDGLRLPCAYVPATNPATDPRPYFVTYNYISWSEADELKALEEELRGRQPLLIKTAEAKAKVRRVLELRHKIDQEYTRLLLLGEPDAPFLSVPPPHSSTLKSALKRQVSEEKYKDAEDEIKEEIVIEPEAAVDQDAFAYGYGVAKEVGADSAWKVLAQRTKLDLKDARFRAMIKGVAAYRQATEKQQEPESLDPIVETGLAARVL